MTEEQLSALLRLKRYEQPPPGYFDGLLRDLHRRQREELLHRPLWKIGFERMQTFFGEHSMGMGAYAGAMATVFVAGAGFIGLMTQGSIERSESGPAGQIAAASAATTPAPLSLQPSYVASTRRNGASSSESPLQTASPSTTRRDQTRYVIDARPVSYERSFSF